MNYAKSKSREPSRWLRRPAVVLSVVLLVPILTPPPAHASAPDRPNILLILVDDLGYHDLGCYGSSFHESPKIDKLAKSGMIFTNAYAACPVCSPTRVSLMTGKYPTRLATTNFFGAPQPEQAAVNPKWKHKKLLPAAYTEQLALEQVTLAELLRGAGYATFFAGKWHMGGDGFGPLEQGFEINRGGCQAGHPKSYFSPYRNPTLADGPVGEHLPDRLASETVEFIHRVSKHALPRNRRGDTNATAETSGDRGVKNTGDTSHGPTSKADAAAKRQPFFAFLSFYSVHTPLQGRPDLVAKYQEKQARQELAGDEFGTEHEGPVRIQQNHAVYAAMVEAMDAAVGKVLSGLDEAGLTNDTVIIFTSDNGGLSTAEGTPTSNAPLRAGKGWLYEGGIREPFIIRWPGITSPGSRSDRVVISPDVVPTVLEIAGIHRDELEGCDGESCVATLRGNPPESERGPVYWHYPHYSNQRGGPGGAVREGDWKLIEWYEDNRLELYNLKTDPGEQHDLSDDYRDKAEQLRNLLHRWRKETSARMPTPNPNP